MQCEAANKMTAAFTSRPDLPFGVLYVVHELPRITRSRRISPLQRKPRCRDDSRKHGDNVEGWGFPVSKGSRVDLTKAPNQ